jgi:hypothetical protein
MITESRPFIQVWMTELAFNSASLYAKFGIHLVQLILNNISKCSPVNLKVYLD